VRGRGRGRVWGRGRGRGRVRRRRRLRRRRRRRRRRRLRRRLRLRLRLRLRGCPAEEERPRRPDAHRMPTRGFSATTGVRQRARTLHAPVQGALCPLNSAPSPLTTTPFSTQAPPTLRGAAAPARARAYVQPRSDLPPRANLLARLVGGVAAPRGAGLAGGAAAASPRLGSGGVIG
jgi:hypothetical protein